MYNLNQREFKLLLLVHAANCDYSYHKKEKNYIENLADKETIDKLYAIYDKEKIESFSYLIKYFNEFFPTLEGRLELRRNLIELFHIDEKFCQFEKGFEKYFNHLAKLDA